MKLKTIFEGVSFSKAYEALNKEIKNTTDSNELVALNKKVSKALDDKKITAGDFDELSADIGRKQSKSSYK